MFTLEYVISNYQSAEIKTMETSVINVEQLQSIMNTITSSINNNPHYEGFGLHRIKYNGRVLWSLEAGFNIGNINYLSMISGFNKSVG